MLFEAKPEIDIHEQSPIALAFVGDGVFEVLVRARLVERTRLVPNRLHAAAVKFVSAKGQYAALEVIAPLLDEAERAVVRRGKKPQRLLIRRFAHLRTGSNSLRIFFINIVIHSVFSIVKIIDADMKILCQQRQRQHIRQARAGIT